MDFGNLEYIENPILRLSKNLILKNVVRFGSRQYQTNKRVDSLREISYSSNKYDNYNYVGKLTLETSNFLVFSYYKSKEENLEIYTSYPHLLNIKNTFKTIERTAIEEQVFYEIDDDRLGISEEYKNYRETIKNLPNGNTITLFYSVINDPINSTSFKTIEIPAVTFLFMNNNVKFQETISFEVFQWLVDFMNDFNLLLSSQNLTIFAYLNRITKALKLESTESYPDYSVGYSPVLKNKKLHFDTKKQAPSLKLTLPKKEELLKNDEEDN